MAGNQKPAGEARRMSNNETISAREKLGAVLAELENREAELSAVLPPDISFDQFHATINQALRNNPDLLGCTMRSLVNACVKAAYDGLRVDGREAAIVWEMATVKVPGKPDRKEKQARYMPMYQGLVQQVLRGGMVLACEADVIYENDEHQLIGGTNRDVIHRINTDPDFNRGRMVAAYNVATLPSGYKVTHYMLAADIVDIQKESRSGWDSKNNCSKGVWKRWPKEQWKKTVLRQHRKTLPVGRGVTIRDMEMSEEFPQFDRSRAHPQLAATPARPRRQAPALEHFGNEAGTPLDFGDDAQREVIDNDAPGNADQAEERRQQVAEEKDRAAGAPAIELPADAAEWDMWKGDMLRKIRAAVGADAVNEICDGERQAIDVAPKDIRDAVTGAASERITALMLGDDDEQEGEA